MSADKYLSIVFCRMKDIQFPLSIRYFGEHKAQFKTLHAPNLVLLLHCRYMFILMSESVSTDSLVLLLFWVHLAILFYYTSQESLSLIQTLNFISAKPKTYIVDI